MDFGKKVTLIRKEKGLSQIKLASGIGKSQAYLSSIESGDRFISQDILWEIIDGLRIDRGSIEAKELIVEWLEDCGEIIFETCPLDLHQRDLLLTLQEELENLNDEKCQEIQKIINSDG